MITPISSSNARPIEPFTNELDAFGTMRLASGLFLACLVCPPVIVFAAMWLVGRQHQKNDGALPPAA